MRVLRFNPIIFLLPGNGEMKLQPLWIQDLISCLALSRHDDRTIQKIFTVGGGEFLSYKDIVRIVMKKTGKHRILVPFSPAYLRTLNLWLGRNERGFPYTNAWLDFLASDRTCALDTLPKLFGLLPARFEKKIDLLI
jgi:NADH dehydrogenase